MNTTSEEGFIPYLVLIRFDKGADLRDRLEESLPILQAALAEIGNVQPVLSSYDGSATSYLLAARADVQPWQVIEQLHSPRSRRGSPLKTLDKVLVVSIEFGLGTRLEPVTEWLTEHGILG